MSTTIQLHGLTFEKSIDTSEIQKGIERVAQAINNDLEGKNPLFVVVLNGAFRFAAQLIDRFEGDCQVEFVRMSSYDGTQSTGNVISHLDMDFELEDRNVVIIEDIVDSGQTIEKLLNSLCHADVCQMKIATLFYKPDTYDKEYKIDYYGLKIPNDFIVGYGLDYNGLGRNLNHVYKLKSSKMTNLVLFGPPGAGKGTQATILKEKYDLIHISTGDVFRYNIKNETELGKLAKSYIDKGQLVPDTVTIEMLNAEVEKNPEAKGFIFDGFPRTKAQAKALDELLASKGTEVAGMIALEVEDEVLVQRLLGRGKTSGRADDADENVIRNRIKVYYAETAILREYYMAQDKFYGVDGLGEIDEITQRLSDVIDEL